MVFGALLALIPDPILWFLPIRVQWFSSGGKIRKENANPIIPLPKRTIWRSPPGVVRE
jgi:hypothetical protein